MPDDPSELLAGDVLHAARGLLGRRLTSHIGGSVVSVVITEVEAYGGEDDPASHAHQGRTTRNASMFSDPGTLYVYRSYGVHWCANVVTGPAGSASAVLLRAGWVTEGMDTVRRRRGRRDRLTDGPGKLAQALAITGDHDGTSALTGPVGIGDVIARGPIASSPRVGISRATTREWRLVLTLPAGSLSPVGEPAAP